MKNGYTNKSRLTVALLVLIVICLIGAAAAFWSKSQKGDVSPMIDISAWKTSTDSTLGVSFRYPEVLSTQYIRTSEWPPKMTLKAGPFLCVEAGDAVGPGGKTQRRVVNGRLYCLSTSSEGAAGSVYTQYSYVWDKDGLVPTLTFTLRSVQCANYDEPSRSECEAERTTFGVDVLADRMARTLTVSGTATKTE